MAASLSTSFHALVLMARRKISEEKARIEDDAATSLDVSKVYDMHMLLPRRDIISLDQYRRVKARDSFQMRLYHSSDDLIERNIELILREPSSRTKFSEGEILFVEVGEDSSKSLLFPPIPLSAISSRTGDAAGEIVVMVRGVDHELTEWREIMALASSTAAGFEWVQMLGLVPIPPEGPFSKEPIEPAVLETVIEESIAPSRHYSPAQPRRGKSRRTPKAQPEATNDNVPVEPDTNTASEPAEEKIKQIPIAMSHGWLPLDFSAGLLEVPTGYQGNFGGNFEVPKVNFKVQKPDNDARDITRSPSLHTLSESDIGQSPSAAPSIKRSHRASRRHSRSSSITSEESLHSGKQLTRAASVHLDDQERESVEANLKKHAMDNIPDLSPSKAKKTEGSSPPPPVPPHRTPTNASNRSGPPPTSAGNKSRFGGRRRTSSPLKHEYDPSLSNSDSERLEGEKLIQEDEDHDYTSSSEPSSSEDEDSDDAVSLCSEEEDGDYPPPLLSIPRGVSRQTSRTMMQSTSMDSLGISDNSSELTQRPTAPSQPDQPPPPVPQIGARFKCYIFVWATNQWDKLSTGECRLLITPGRIEAYPIVQTSPNGTAEAAIDFSLNQSEQIFAFDLNTKLAIRRGTAVDISIRSPPNSKLAGASIMLRLKSPNECEALHGAINTYRIYPQDLQLPLTTTVSSLNLSSEISDSSTAVAGNIKRGFGAWAKSKTYRAGSTPSLVSSPSETSINSISSAFSRLRANKIFKNSPLSSATSSTSSMENSRNGSPMGLPNVPGIENSIVSMSPMKVRLYRRENASKWRDLGNARLNVLKPNEGQRGKSINEDDKRVVITNKKGDAILLDVVLGESAFERVARTGIAISILTGEGEEDGTLKPADIGGIGAKNTVYMMQASDMHAMNLFANANRLLNR